jgi:serine/threonine protein kinase
LDTYAAEQRHRKRVYHHGRQTQSPFMEDHVKTLTKQLLSAVEWCHRHFLIHRDIKPSNLLYTSNGVLKLCDFGLSRHCSGRVDRQLLTPNVVSLWYRAPELLFKRARGSTASSYSFPIDLFAIGCVFCELLQGFPLLDGKTEMEQIDKLMQCLGQPPTRLYEYRPPTLRSSNFSALWDRFEYLSTEGLTLMTRLLEYDSLQRWTANQALESAYFRLRPLPATKMPSLRELGIETQY